MSGTAKTNLLSRQQKAKPWSQLRISQFNLKGSRQRAYGFQEHMRDQCVTIGVCQDPPAEFPFTGTPGYNIWYHTAKDPKPEDVSLKDNKLEAVCFFVKDTISAADWSVELHEHLKKLVATLRLKTAIGDIFIHNIYNRDILIGKEIPVSRLVETCTRNGRDIILGDFNLTHWRWGGPGTRSNHGAADDLAIQTSHMTCLRNGEITWTSTVAEAATRRSTIDLAFVTPELSPLVLSSVVQNKRVCRSDHRIIDTVFDLGGEEDNPPRYRWSQADPDEYCEAFRDAIKPIGFPPMATEADVDKYVGAVLDAYLLASDQTVVKKRRPNPKGPPSVSALNDAPVELSIQLEDELLNSLGDESDPVCSAELSDRFLHQSHKTNLLIARARTRVYRKHLASSTKDARGTFKRARFCENYGKPRAPPHLPNLEIKGRLITEPKEKTYALMESLHPGKYRVVTEHSEPMVFKPPQFDSNRTQYSCLDDLKSGEISNGLSRLREKVGKAAGHDELANEALIMSRGVAEPYLEHLFRACLQLRYHPVRFKHCRTILLRKPNKKAQNPGAWRPIDILQCLGKFYERILTDRYVELATKYNLLPLTQFGGVPGRSTTDGLCFLFDIIYRGWTEKLAVSMLSLDISSAYPSIDPEKLLQRLGDKGIPDWLIETTASFLSNRTIDLEVPGQEHTRFHIDGGIPQGSPLSPILFLFFAAPLIELVESWECHPGTYKFAFAFVDDTNIVVLSETHDKNCQLLEELHDVLTSWAERNCLTFNPSKYEIVHFRPPRTKKDSWPGIDKVPKIQGLNPETAIKKEYKLLGLVITPDLNWTPHVKGVVSAVKYTLQKYGRIANSISGIDLCQMRQVYLTKLRSKIAYACPAWWIPPSEHVKRTWTMKQCDVKSLNQLQYVCLKLVSGARNRTPQRVIEKEVYVDPIEVFAHRLRVAHHARVLGSREFRDQQRLLGRISKESSKPKKTVRISKMSSKPKKTVRIQHPYHHVREEAWLVKKGSHATIQSIDDGYEAKARFIDLAREIMSQTQSMLGESHDLSKEAIDLLRNLSMGASELEQIAFNEMKAWQEAGLVSEVRTGALDATNPRFYAMARQLEERARPFAALSDLYGPVRDLERRARWYDPQKRKETINEYARTRATFKSRRIWLDVLSEWESRHTQSFSRSAKPLAHHGGWGPHNLKWYKGLSKAQCSLLIQCRTGWVGLNASSDMRHVNGTKMCPCGKWPQTVEHVFLHCQTLLSATTNQPLAIVRNELTRKLNSLNLRDMFSKDAAITTWWGIRHIPIQTYDYVRNNLDYDEGVAPIGRSSANKKTETGQTREATGDAAADHGDERDAEDVDCVPAQDQSAKTTRSKKRRRRCGKHRGGRNKRQKT